jgi:hypothetical protein
MEVIRKIFKKIFIHLFIYSRPFEYLVLFTIFCNCAALALSKPLPNNDTTPTNYILVNN